MESPFIQKIESGAVWENKVGYSRAIKAGNLIEISGTTAPGKNEYEQTCAIIEKAKETLNQLDADLSHVIRTRMYCTDITKWEAIGRTHRKFFKNSKPATTMVQVAALIAPEILVEIEFTAILPDLT